MGFIKSVNSQSFHAFLSLPTLPFICWGPRPKKPDSVYLPIWAHMGLWHMLARVRAAWIEMEHVDSRLQSIPHALVSGHSSTRYSSFLSPAIPEEHCQLRLHPERRSARHPPPLVLLPCIPSDLISCLWVSYGNVFPQRVCLSTAKYTWHSQQGRSMEQWAQRKQ